MKATPDSAAALAASVGRALARERSRFAPSVRNAWALTALAGGLVLFGLAARAAAPVPYAPGQPLYAAMPAAFFPALALAALAVFLAGGPRTRFTAAATVALVVALPLVLLLPLGHLHDSNRNLLISMATLAGQKTGMYHDAFPGYWATMGLLHHLGGGNPWDFLRWYPVGVTLAYALLDALLVKGFLRTLNVPERTRGLAVGVSVFVILAVGPLVWIRNNLAPESYGFATGLALTYFALRGVRAPAFRYAFLASAAALVVSHPLSPVLLAPGILAAWSAANGATHRLPDGVREGFRGMKQPFIAAAGVFYAGWILYASSWIIPHGVGIVQGALAKEKEVTSLTRLVPGSNQVALLTIAFLALLVLAIAPLILEAYRGPVRGVMAAWVFFMAPIVLVTFGGRFLSRPVLFLLVPLGLAIGHAVAMLETRAARTRAARGPPRHVVAAVLLVIAVTAGAGRAGYVESMDRPTPDELAAYAFAYDQAPPRDVYRTSLGLHFMEDGSRLHGGSPLLHGGRAFDPEKAADDEWRLLTRHALAYGAVQQLNDWPITPEDVALEAANASIAYSNGDNLVLRGIPRIPVPENLPIG